MLLLKYSKHSFGLQKETFLKSAFCKSQIGLEPRTWSARRHMGKRRSCVPMQLYFISALFKTYL